MSTYTPISTQTVGASAVSTITFSGIPQGYTDLILVCNVKTTTTTNAYLWAQFNSDTASNYSVTVVRGSGSAAQSTRNSSATKMYLNYSYLIPTTFDCAIITQIQNYSNSTTNKTVLSRSNIAASGVEGIVGLWRSTTTAAITSITISTDNGGNIIDTGSTFTLYGIGAGSPKAFGGDEVRTDGTYWYHIYRSSGTFAPMTALTCDYLVIAGGGAGGSNYQGNTPGAGGGAGGYRTTVGTSGGGSSAESPLSLTSGTNYVVTVGAGGTGGSNAPTASTSGSNSVFSTITSTGGGRGGGLAPGPVAAPAENGGSGGGGRGTADAGTGTNNQGTNGAKGFDGFVSGGGGGSSAAAVTPGSRVGGNGGAGTASSITGSSVTRAGGGGGGNVDNNSQGAGGSGGGGNGAIGNPGVGGNATVNTGSGGGGGGNNGGGGNGGSGIVVVRYAV